MKADEEPIHFQSVEEFESRPSFVSPLRIASEELEKIVGKYIFPKEIACSLNGCKTPHKRGFIIRTKGGLETNCGHQCGKREFDVDWDELHAKFVKAEDAALAKKMVEQLLGERHTLLAQAKDLTPQLDNAAQSISFFRECFGKYPGFMRSLETCIKQGGSVMADKPRSEFDIKNNRPAVRMLFASIKGCAVLTEDLHAMVNSITYKAMPWLDSLTGTADQVLDTKQLQELLKQAQFVRGQLAKAEQLVSHANIFNRPENAKAFEVIRSLLMRKGPDRDDLEEVIHKWVAGLPQFFTPSVEA